jgi:aspergillopepsin I
VQQRNGHTFYALANTTGQVLDGYSWKISYGDGSGASGIVYADKVTIGDATATQQAVEAATSVSSQFVREASDGLLGLGFGHTNTIKPTRQQTFFENIKISLKEPLFTVTLKKNATGTYDFGYIDEKKFIVGDPVHISFRAS